MIDVTDASGTAEATVTIWVTGTPLLTETYGKRDFVPTRLTMKYSYQPVTDEAGWTHHTWKPVIVTAMGPRILKPAADGSQRLGAGTLTYNPIYVDDAPEWLLKLAAELAPSGEVTLAGA